MMAFVGRLAATAPLAYLSYVLFNVWLAPMQWDGGSWVIFGVGLLLLEFVSLHSGMFLVAGMRKYSPLSNRFLFIGLLVAGYTLIMYGFSLEFGGAQLMWVFAGVMLGRLVSLGYGDDTKAAAGLLIARSSVGIALYVILGFASVLVPIPELGITDEVLSEVYPDRVGGVWGNEPHRAIAMAAMYFGLMALAEWFLISRPVNPLRPVLEGDL